MQLDLLIGEDMDLAGKRVIVTGAGSGIGRAVAVGYAHAGAKVVCLSRRIERLHETVQHIQAAEGIGYALEADVCDFPALQRQFDQAEKALGGLDLVFAAAGESSDNKRVEFSDPQSFRRTLEVNLVGAFNTAKAAVAPLQRSGGGQVIFVGSGMGHRASATRAAYATSKAGLSMLVRVLAQEYLEVGIAFNELIPGPVETEFIAGRTEQLRQAAGVTEWFKQPEDVVPLAVFMAAQPRTGPTGQIFSLARREL